MKRYYGWTITWALAITQTIGFGVLYYAFSVFIEPMEAEFGWSRAQTSGAFSLALLTSGLVALPIGRWIDRHGARAMMTVGSVAGVLLVLAWSVVTNLLLFYLIQAGIGLVMAATFYEVAFTVVAVWFRHKRKQAMLIITLVAGLASTIFIPLTTLLVEIYPWRDALRLLAILLALGTVPLHALVLRRRPEDLGLEPDGGTADQQRVVAPEKSIGTRAALKGATFWWMTAAVGLDRITIIAVAAHSVPMLLERGYSAALVAAAVGSIGLMQLLGRVIFAPFQGRVSLVILTAAVYATHTFSVVSLMVIPGLLGLWVFVTLFGMANGATTLARAALLADVYGPTNYGSISGIMISLVAVFQVVAPLGAGFLHDAFGNYTPVLVVLALASAVASLAALQINLQRTSYAD
jgi:MFS family permease